MEDKEIMPLDDGYQREKYLKELSEAIAHGITDQLMDDGTNREVGFALFLIDTSTGLLQYISDMQKQDVQAALKAHLARDLQ